MDGRVQGRGVSHCCTERAIKLWVYLESTLTGLSVPPRLRYDVALLYLKQTDYDLEAAIEAYKEDEKWEKEHPLESSTKGKAKQSPRRRRFGVGAGITGQLS